MKILLEAHHPAHIHFWKYPVRELLARSHEVLLIGRDRDVMRRLLEVYDWIPSVIPPRRSKRNRFPLVEMLQRQWTVAKWIRRFKPDVVASLMGSYTQSAKVLGVRNIIFTDSEFQHFNHSIAHPFADAIHTPECFYKDLGRKQRRYRGIHELAFLDPKYFDARSILKVAYPELLEEPYAVVRLSAWNTFHDLNHSGVGERLVSFIELMRQKYRVIISAEESALPDVLKAYAAEFAPEDFHAILSGASFVLTEGASTASEAACLGVPTVYINDTAARGYLNMLERDYGLVRSFSDAERGLAAASEWIESLAEGLRMRWHQRSLKHLHDSVDVVEYAIDTLLDDQS